MRIVIEGSEAGGHIGPVSLTVLAQEILPHVRDVPVFVAGRHWAEATRSLAYLRDGRGRRAARHAGSRRRRKASPIPRFKQAFIRANAPATRCRRCSSTSGSPVIPVRALANAGDGRISCRACRRETVRQRFDDGDADARKQAQLAIEHFWAGALRRAVIEGDVETGSVMAGQSVGMVTAEQPIAAIIAELVAQARDALDAP